MKKWMKYKVDFSDSEGKMSYRMRLLSFIIFLWLILKMQFAQSRDLKTSPCGVIEYFDGDLQVFDEKRKHPQEVKPHFLLECGSWVSVRQGWVRIKHSSGAIIQGKSQTIFQLLGKMEEDSIVLYQGALFLSLSNGAEALRILSPLARASIQEGKAIVFSEKITQLLALKNKATLENRFEPSQKVEVLEGEMTELNGNLLRVIPSTPKVISLEDLRPRLYALELRDSDISEAIASVVRRKNRSLASIPSSSQSIPRARFSTELSDQQSQKKLQKKIIGDVPLTSQSSSLIYPSPIGERRFKSDLERSKIEERDKKQLVEELSKIKMH